MKRAARGRRRGTFDLGAVRRQETVSESVENAVVFVTKKIGEETAQEGGVFVGITGFSRGWSVGRPVVDDREKPWKTPNRH